MNYTSKLTPFRRIFSRFDKLDIVFKFFIHFALIVDTLIPTTLKWIAHEAAYVLAKGYPDFPEKPLNDVQRWIYSGNASHPTQKAVQVIKPLIQAFSQPGDLVLDPFSGSGTTAIAAALSGRDYLGIELEPGYCTLARNRLASVYLPRAI